MDEEGSKNPILVTISCLVIILQIGFSCSETDTLAQGQQLKVNDHLISSSGIFKLGFFNAEGKQFIGIWYKKNNDQHENWYFNRPVWVANRNVPVFGKSVVLRISPDGNLEILQRGRIPVALTSVQASGNTSATLLDSGNLVLHERNLDGTVKQVLWQSFDYPTDTLLPGMKLGVHLKTGHTWSLRSWINEISPAEGSFTLKLEQDGRDQLIILWAGDAYWTSGSWEDGHFSLSRELSDQDYYYFRYVSNDNETYFSYDAAESFPRLTIEDFGLSSGFRRPFISCKEFYFYKTTLGCVDGKHPICWRDNSRFHYLRGSVSGNAFKFNGSENMSIEDCKQKCLRNCSCVAYAATNERDNTGCEIWTELRIEKSVYEKYWRTVHVYKSKENRWLQVLIFVVGGVLAASLLCFFCILIWGKHIHLIITRTRAMISSWLCWIKEHLLLIWRKCKEKVVEFLQSSWKTMKVRLVSWLCWIQEHLFLTWRKCKEKVVEFLQSRWKTMKVSWLCWIQEHLFLTWRKCKEKVVEFLQSRWKTMKVSWLCWIQEHFLLTWRKCKEKIVEFLQSKWNNKKVNSDHEKEMLLQLHELSTDARHDPGKSYKNGSTEVMQFSFKSLASATNNFASSNKLGEGGFGPVYKGELPDGQEVAIKRLARSSQQGLLEFKNEVEIIAKLQHDNLVRLVGYCIEKEEKMLIYEYMPNKSLDFFLFDAANQKRLDWKTRLNIIEEIAQGLLYLQKYSRLKIIHRDLKASNILLDANMKPKISDFGMAKIFQADEFKARTKRVAGTFGYMSPEYAIGGVFSTKSDVFSFGVLLLEIVSGRKNSSYHNADGPCSLIVHAWELWRQGRATELIDPVIGCETHQNEAVRCINLGLLCVQDKPIDRPTMSHFMSMLYNQSQQLPSPKQPAFYYRSDLRGAEIVEQEQEKWSLNKASITEMEAR